VAVAVTLAPALWPAQPAAADPASIGGLVSTAAGAATDTKTGVKQALAAADSSPRVPAASASEPPPADPVGQAAAPVTKTVDRTAGAVTQIAAPAAKTVDRTAGAVTQSAAPAGKAVDRTAGAVTQSAAPAGKAVDRTAGAVTQSAAPAAKTADRTAQAVAAATTGVERATGGTVSPVIDPVRTAAEQLAPVADVVRRTTERVAPPAHVVPPALPALLPPAAGQGVPPIRHKPASVIPLRPGITRPPLPPAAIAGPAASEVRAGTTFTPQSETVAAIQADPRVLTVPPAGSGARRAGTVLPALPAPDAVRGGEASFDVLGRLAPAAATAGASFRPRVARHSDPTGPAAPASPAGAGAGAAGAASSSAVSLFAVLCLSGVLAAWLLWRLLPAPAVRRPAAFSWLLERPG
jgi:hypothetical protein